MREPEYDATDATTHPRPLLRRPSTSLEGDWGFTADPDAAATRPDQVAFADRITVPFTEMPSAYRPGPTLARRLIAEWPEVIRAATLGR